MKCKEAELEIIPFYCGELDGEKAKEYTRHTTVCRDCARLSFKLRKTKKYLEENKPQRQDADLSDEILKRK